MQQPPTAPAAAASLLHTPPVAIYEEKVHWMLYQSLASGEQALPSAAAQKQCQSVT
jgi:hypothetical protein